MFTDESKMMLDTLEAPVCGASTNGTLGNVIQAINNIFDQHADAICCSPERPDLQMSKEEGEDKEVRKVPWWWTEERRE